MRPQFGQESDRAAASLVQDGFVVLPGALRPPHLRRLRDELDRVLRGPQAGHRRVYEKRGAIYAARNLLDVYPSVVKVLARPDVASALASLEREPLGVVRALFLDKPPGRSWAIPWHRDVTIAVKDNSISAVGFTNPTIKAGVPHVEAPVELLVRMIIVRIHLDSVTDDNGPVVVVPGSHRSGKAAAGDCEVGEPRVMLHDAGDVLLIRPLVLHRSMRSKVGIELHRRVLHLELAPEVHFPGGFRWHQWVPVCR